MKVAINPTLARSRSANQPPTPANTITKKLPSTLVNGINSSA